MTELEEKLECYKERLDYIATQEDINCSGSCSYYFIKDDRHITEDQLEFVSYDNYNLKESVNADMEVSLAISKLDEFIQAYKDASKDGKITTVDKLRKELEEEKNY